MKRSSKYKVGKYIAGSLYIHKNYLDMLPSYVQKLISHHNKKFNFDIIKFNESSGAITLVKCLDFDKQDEPEIIEQRTLHSDGISKTIKLSSNPFIYHHKWMMVDDNYSGFDVTQSKERSKLWTSIPDVNKNKIGRKKYWFENVIPIIKAKQKDTKHTPIKRHKTAISRSSLSRSFKSLLKHNFLTGKHSIFDYGCGKADDITMLKRQGIECWGWDPYHKKSGVKRHADVVNLGFVLNVIENISERIETLKEAYSYSNKLLVISVMLEAEANYVSGQPFGDGFKSSTGTFQKFYDNKEALEFIYSSLGRQAVPVGAGTYFIFRNDQDELAFLEQRSSSRISIEDITKWALPSDKNQRIYERHKDLFRNFWTEALKKGRLPRKNETSIAEEITSTIGSIAKAYKIIADEKRTSNLEIAAQKRKKDLLLFLALGEFQKRKSFNSLGPSLKNDIKYFLGSYSSGRKIALNNLHSCGDADLLLNTSLEASKDGLGYFDGKFSFTFERNRLQDLPLLLRIYVGCASQLYGDIDEADLIKIHIKTGKLTLQMLEDYSLKQIPLMRRRIKIDMVRGNISFFDYDNNPYPPHPLYLKSRYMNPNKKKTIEQIEFDDFIKKVINFDYYGEYGPSADQFLKIMNNKNKS